MTGYTRQSSAQILTGEVVRAAPLNAEFNQVQSAFNSSTGHTHSGATGEGPVIDRIGDTNQYNLVFVNDSLNEIEFFTEVSSSPTKQISIADGVIKPAVTNDLDLGSSSNKFKDIYIAGTSYLDSVDINGGTGSFTSLVATTSDINGGTLDNVSIGATTPGTGSFTTLNTSGNVGIGMSNPVFKLDVSGNARLVGTSTESRFIEIGTGRTGNGNSYIDFVGDTTYTDYGARIIRENTGPNTSTKIKHRGTGDLSLVAEDAGSVLFYTNNLQRMRIDELGRVGIGTSNLLGQFHVVRGAATAGWVLRANSDGIANESGVFVDSSNNMELAARDGSGVLNVNLKSNGDSYLTGGNIGIGTSSPTSRLDVKSNSDIQIEVERDGAGGGFIGVDSSNVMNIGSLGAVDIAFKTNNTERMRIDSSGNVGIGTSNPAKKLDVDGQLRIRNGGVTGYALLEYGSGAVATNNWHVGSEGDGSFRFYNGNLGAGTERMRINSDGNVGIGTSTPVANLQVETSTDTNLAIVSSTSGVSSIDFGDSDDRNAGLIQYLNTDNAMTFRTSGSGEDMRINSSGNVGIGVSNPLTKLDVAGNARLVGTSTEIRYLSIGQGRTGNGVTHIDLVGDTTYSTYGARIIRANSGPNASTSIRNRGTGGLQLVAEDAGYVQFYTNSLQRMSINPSGDVGIGVSNPADKLDVSGNMRLRGTSTEDRRIEIGLGRTGNGTSFIDLIGDTTYNNYGARFIRNNTGLNTTTDIRHRGTGGLRFIAEDAGKIEFSTTDIERMRIDSSGNIGIGTSTPGEKLHIAGGSTTGSLIVTESTSTSQFSGGGIALMNGATSNDSHVLINTYIRDSDSSDSGFTINQIDGNRGYVKTLANYDLSSHFWNFFTNGLQRMRIDSSGNVGIGTSSASERLEVSGKIKTTSGGVEFPDGTTQTTAAAPPGTVGSAVDGTATVPAFSFTSDNNTGLFRDGSGTVKVTSDGTEELTLLRASQAQAEAGTNNSVMMTPLRTAQAIQELSPNNAIPLSFVGFL